MAEEAAFVSVRDVYKEAVERIAKAVERFEATLIDAWTAKATFDIETAFDVGPLGAENIVGLGVGEKVTEGVPTGELCMKVYVVDKAPEDEIEEAFIVPEEFEGEPTDVEEVGIIEALRFNRRYRPAPGGVSIGHTRITAGTLGGFCLSDTPKEPILILSNNHVLANENNARPGDPIVQPGPYDGGRHPRDTIATLLDFVPIDFSGRPNLVDAALAKPTDPKLVRPEILKKGKVRGACPPVLRTRVKKSGRTTQNTHGVISGVGATVRVRYLTGIALFRNQVVITPGGFSAGGDSGSLILDTKNRARALLFAGSATHTIANPIQLVISELSKPPRPIRGLRIRDA